MERMYWRWWKLSSCAVARREQAFGTAQVDCAIGAAHPDGLGVAQPVGEHAAGAGQRRQAHQLTLIHLETLGLGECVDTTDTIHHIHQE
jgi:hypothetical protein